MGHLAACCGGAWSFPFPLSVLRCIVDKLFTGFPVGECRPRLNFVPVHRGLPLILKHWVIALVTELHVAMHLRMHKCHDAGRQTLRALVLNIACCQTSPALHSTAATQKETGKRGQDLVAGRRAIVITWWSPFIPLPHPAHSRRRLSSTVCPNRHTAATNASHVRCLSLPSPHVGPTTSLET